MTYKEFIRKVRYIQNLDITTDDADLKKSLEKVIKKEINEVCKKYYK